MTRIKPLMFLPPLIFAVFGAMFFIGLQRENPDALPSTMTGRVVPEVDLVPLEGKTPFTSEVLKEPGVKLVNYWASWCAPCRVEHPQILQLAREGVKIYGINYKDEPKNALAFLEELIDPYTAVAADPKGRNAIEWGVYGIPETFVIDGKGRIVLRFAGPITQRVLENTIRPAMAKAAAQSGE